MIKKPSYEELESRIVKLLQQLDQYQSTATKYRRLFESHLDAVYLLSDDGKIIHPNGEARYVNAICEAALIIVSAICYQGLKPLAIINRPYRTVEAPSGRQTIARQFIAGWPKR